MARSPAQTAKPVGLRSSPRCRQTDDTPGCWRQFYPDSLTPYDHAAQFLRLDAIRRRLAVGGFEIAVSQYCRLGQCEPAEAPRVDQYGHLLLDVAIECEQRDATVFVCDGRQLEIGRMRDRIERVLGIVRRVVRCSVGFAFDRRPQHVSAREATHLRE